MLVKNTTARILTVNVKKGQSYRVLPGNHPAVEISKEAEKLEFTKDLLKRGWLKEVEAQEEKQPTEKEQLKEDLEALGVEVKSSWTVAQMKENLEKATNPDE